MIGRRAAPWFELSGYESCLFGIKKSLNYKTEAEERWKGSSSGNKELKSYKKEVHCACYVGNILMDINVSTHKSQPVIYSLLTHLRRGSSASGGGSCCQSTDVKGTVTLV